MTNYVEMELFMIICKIAMTRTLWELCYNYGRLWKKGMMLRIEMTIAYWEWEYELWNSYGKSEMNDIMKNVGVDILWNVMSIVK